MKFNDLYKGVMEEDKDFDNYSTTDLLKAYEEISQFYGYFKEALDARAEKIGRKYAKATNEKLYGGLESIEYNATTIRLNTSYSHCSGCGTDYEDVEFPKSYLLMTDEELDRELNSISQKRLDAIQKREEAKKQRELAEKVDAYNRLKGELEASGVING